jgi:hypothetical protein
MGYDNPHLSLQKNPVYLWSLLFGVKEQNGIPVIKAPGVQLLGAE